MIKLVINADDFGYSKVFNEKILDLLRKGFLKSTTVLVNWITDEQEKQVERLKKLKDASNISVGLHVESKSKTGPDLDKVEIEKQYKKFQNIFGFMPSHLDVHKFLENIALVTEFAQKVSLPVRNHAQDNIQTKHTTQTAFDFQDNDWVFNWDNVMAFVDSMQDGETYELVVHPGEYDPDSKSSLNEDRIKDYEGMIRLQPLLKEKNIKIISYYEL